MSKLIIFIGKENWVQFIPTSSSWTLTHFQRFKFQFLMSLGNIRVEHSLEIGQWKNQSVYLLAQTEQWWCQKNVLYLFEVNNKDTRIVNFTIVNFNRFETLFWRLYCWLSTSRSRIGRLKVQALLWKLISVRSWRCYGNVNHLIQYIKLGFNIVKMIK